VTLTRDERDALSAFVLRGRHSSQEVLNALIHKRIWGDDGSHPRACARGLLACLLKNELRPGRSRAWATLPEWSGDFVAGMERFGTYLHMLSFRPPQDTLMGPSPELWGTSLRVNPLPGGGRRRLPNGEPGRVGLSPRDTADPYRAADAVVPVTDRL
jgi:hypothetical protein